MKFNILDIFRGLAAIWVFIYHLGSDLSYHQSLRFFDNFLSNGHLGVQMFFVISGFCVMSSLRYSLATKEKPSSFIFRRAKRVYITFWFSIIFVALLPFLMEFISSLKTGKYVSPFHIEVKSYEYLYFSIFDWMKTLSLLMIFESYENVNWLSDKFNSINGVYWSLAIEMQFYLIMFVALLCRTKINIILVFTTIFSLIAIIYYPENHISGWFFYFWHYFVLGIILNTLFHLGIRPCSYQKFQPVFKLLLFFITALLLYLLFTNNNLNAVVFAILFCLILWLIEVYEVKYVNKLRQKNIFCLTLNLLGLISYSVYLIHSKLILLVQMFVRQVLMETNFLFIPICFLLTLFGCYIFYLFCEKPFYSRKVTNEMPSNN